MDIDKWRVIRTTNPAYPWGLREPGCDSPNWRERCKFHEHAECDDYLYWREAVDDAQWKAAHERLGNRR